ncbi:MAG: R3H domain-containing nucleic acid-binding protein [Myxococcota bacterium]|nr:R3H domain-containing nucleic acid-binding protein [Myxococcota bacterium]
MSENTVTAIGRTVNEAVAKAAEALGIEPEMVEHKLDISHFRNEDGRVIPQDTVKIIARAGDPEEMKARAARRREQLEAAARSESRGRDERRGGRFDRDDRRGGRGRDRDERRPRRRERDDRPAYDGDDSGAQAGRTWLEGLFGHMGVEATVKARAVAENEAVIDIDSPSARHLVGRRGANLRAIRALFGAVMERDGQAGWSYELNVEGGRDRDRDRDRDDRRDRDGRRGDRRSDRDMDKLKKLAMRLADEAVQTGEAVRIRRELNSYERRAVHVTLADHEGVETRSEGEGHTKTVLIVPVGGGEE